MTNILFQLLENVYLRWREYRSRPKDVFWPHEHLDWILKKEHNANSRNS